jgi:hypothetical protein
MLMPIAPERFEEVQRALREESAATAKPDVNLANAIHLADAEVLRFDGRVFHVPPVSGLEGLRLAEMVDAYQQASEGSPRSFRRAHVRLIAYLWRLTTPRGLGGVIWRALLPNPFKHATPKEVGHLLHFFGQRQKISRVQYRFVQDTNRPPIGSN